MEKTITLTNDKLLEAGAKACAGEHMKSLFHTAPETFLVVTMFMMELSERLFGETDEDKDEDAGDEKNIADMMNERMAR